MRGGSGGCSEDRWDKLRLQCESEIRGSTARFLLSCLTIALLSFGVAACGGSKVGAASSPQRSPDDAADATSTGGYLREDDDGAEDEGRDHEDIHDDYSIRKYGHGANEVDDQAVTALVKRYYAAAAAGDGAMGCSLMLASLANESDLGEAAEGAYPPAPGAPVLRGESCGQIVSLLFKEDHERLAADSATMVVIGVRIKRDRGLALLGFRTMPERYIPVQRERGVWRIDSLLDKEIP